MSPPADPREYFYFLHLHPKPTKYVVAFNLGQSTLRLAPYKAFAAVIHTFGSALASIDASPIAFIAFIANNVFDKSQRVTSMLFNCVVVQVCKIVYKLVGSANFLGSPVGLVSNVGNGVKELLYDVQGPARLADGVRRWPLHRNGDVLPVDQQRRVQLGGQSPCGSLTVPRI